MKLLITLLFFCYVISSNAQAPFAPYLQPKRATEKEFHDGRDKGLVKTRSEANRAKADSLKVADYFDHMSANIVVIQDANKLFPTVNGEVMNYRLGLWTQDKVITIDTVINNTNVQIHDTVSRVHNLPFSIITKISSDYMDSSAGPANDATSFFGAPLTFRFAPAFDLFPKTTENKLFLGMNTDLRLLVFGNDAENKIDFGWGAYVSGGFTYMGKAHAFEIDPKTEEEIRYNGKWSFSTLLYWFKSGGKFNQALFKGYEPKSLTGIEMMLRFKTSKKEDSKFNFLVSASNGFTRGAPNFANWQFTIGVGK